MNYNLKIKNQRDLLFKNTFHDIYIFSILSKINIRDIILSIKLDLFDSFLIEFEHFVLNFFQNFNFDKNEICDDFNFYNNFNFEFDIDQNSNEFNDDNFRFLFHSIIDNRSIFVHFNINDLYKIQKSFVIRVSNIE